MQNKQNKKVAVITGGSGGMGRAMAMDFTQKGYHVVLIGRTEKSLKKVSDVVIAKGGSADYYPLDISDAEAIESCIEEIVTHHKRIDILFNTAGVLIHGTSEVSSEEIAKSVAINLNGQIYVANAVANIMKIQKSGYIINVSSVAAYNSRGFAGVYSGTKAGILGYSNSLMRELLPYGVKVTTLIPGLTATEMVVGRNFPLDKMIPIDDIVRTVNYLLSLSSKAFIASLLIDCTEFEIIKEKAITEAYQLGHAKTIE